MTTLLVDGNLDGHADRILDRLASEKWKLFCDHLELQIVHLEDVGLDRHSPDDVVWRLCQENGFFLLTANRNMKTEDSLESTIRREGTSDSLPVFTLSDSDRILESSEYMERVIEKLLDFLIYASDTLGAGRLFLP
ncbi:MAG: ACP S-malonyltransferase [Gemmataceae bacterium]|nr:ACP S-malonyltransferase [Gemmataceae bacterium]